MALEDLTGTGKFIDDLVNTNPVEADPVGQGNDHIFGIKNVLLNTFPNITGPVTATQTELNKIDGYTGTTDQLNLLNAVANPIDNFEGVADPGINPTKMLFRQQSPPTGWILDTGVTSNTALRINNGAHVDRTGSSAFLTIFPASNRKTGNNSVGHTHSMNFASGLSQGTFVQGSNMGEDGTQYQHTHQITGSTGGNDVSHTHAYSMALNYHDFIACIKE